LGNRIYEIVCAYCKKECKKTWSAKYCSVQCIAAKRRDDHTPKRNCKSCGKEFQRLKRRDDSAVYCSRECAFAFKAHRPFCSVYFPICRGCDRLFTSWTKRSKYCCHNCKPRPIYIPKPIKTIACASCGCQIQTRPGRGGTRTYCDLCAESAYHDTRKAAKRLRKARRKNAFVARVPCSEIYKRDGWKCGICHRKVNPSLKVPHPFAKTIDHIIPLSKGGTHEPRNTQLAHFICNSKRGAGGEVQLRLL
jgi:hypothetical protein